MSRALSNDPIIPPATRRKIHAAAQELGYRPDPLLSELAASRWRASKVESGTIIAYVASRRPEGSGGLDLSAAFRDEANVLGYQIEEFVRENFKTSSKLQTILRSRGITDVILGTVYEKSLSVDLDWSKFVAVQLLPGFFALPLHSVVRDHFNVVVAAWQKAVDRGYQRIGIILVEHSFAIMDDVLRRSGVHACQHFLFPHLPAIPPLRHQKLGQRHLAEFVAWVKANDPDVIIGFSGAHEALFRTAFGRPTPYISLHNTPPSSLSGIHDAPATYAREAINLLHFCRRSHQWGIPRQRIDHVLEPTWVEGNSLPMKAS